MKIQAEAVRTELARYQGQQDQARRPHHPGLCARTLGDRNDMDGRDLFDLRATLQRQGIIFAFSGYMTETVLSGVGEAIKQKLTIDDADTRRCAAFSLCSSSRCRTSIRYSAELAAAIVGRRQPVAGNPLRDRRPSVRRAAGTSSRRVTSWRRRTLSG